MKSNLKKRISIALDILLVLVMALILFISINAIISKEKGYTSFFGRVIYAVETDSMKGDYSDSFDKNTLIFAKELKTTEEKKAIKAGDVITFWFLKDGQKKLNTHRVISVIDAGGANCQYKTKGDNKPADAESVMWSDVVAIYQSKMEGLGAVVLFAQSSQGFFVIAVLPSILLFGYCVLLFYSSIKKALDKKREAASEATAIAISEAQKEELRRQILEEMRAEEAKTNPNKQPLNAQQKQNNDSVPSKGDSALSKGDSALSKGGNKSGSGGKKPNSTSSEVNK